MDGENSTKRGKISSLPSSIAKESTIFENDEYILKFAVGPTRDNPGPILLKQAAAAEIFVSKSKGSKRSKSKIITKQRQ